MDGFSAIDKEVWAFVQEMNRTWTIKGDALALSNYFHPDMVAITASDRFRRLGQEACVQGWSDFVKSAQITRWTENDPHIQVFCDEKMAVVSYYFEIDCIINRHSLNLSGRDLFTLVKEEGKWWVVADHYSPFPG